MSDKPEIEDWAMERVRRAFAFIVPGEDATPHMARLLMAVRDEERERCVLAARNVPLALTPYGMVQDIAHAIRAQGQPEEPDSEVCPYCRRDKPAGMTDLHCYEEAQAKHSD